MKFNFNKLVILFVCLSLFLAFNFSSADDSLVSDAIAIRVLPNTNHLSIDTWYKMRGFSGSPQSLIVDGYEAIRDGRTVYVAAANVDNSGAGINKIYTNIYLISYNQESANSTLDTLGQIISHWKFNRNVSNFPTSKCSLSSMVCLEDSDCPSGLVCGNGDTDEDFAFQLNKCVVEETDASLPNTKNCLTDMDCPKGLFCTSNKAKITRDVIRVARLTDFTTYLESYRYQHGSYPTLSAGSYVQNFTFSTWPSWNNVLASALGFGSEMVDPINAFGSCGVGYNPETCWDEENYRFYDNDLSDGIQFPENTFVYAYNSKSDGSEYNLCATIETVSSTPPYEFEGTELNDNSFCEGVVAYGASFTPEPISLLGYNLNGQSGLPFFGTIEINNPDGRILDWSIDTSATDFTGNDWSGAPVLQDHLNPNKKNIVANEAGKQDSYTFLLNILNDSATTTITNKEFTINISDEIPQVQAQDINYNFDGITHLNYSANLFDNNFNINGAGNLIDYILEIDYPDDFPNPKFLTANPTNLILGHGLSHKMERVANGHYRLNITGLLGDLNGDGVLEETADDLKLNDSTHEDVIKLILTISDTTIPANTVSKTFYINILNDAPIFNFSCPEEIRAGTSDMGGEAFECFINLENPDEGTEMSFSTEFLTSSTGAFNGYTDGDLPIDISWNASSSFLSGFVDYGLHVADGADYKLSDKDYSVLKIKPRATNSSGVFTGSFFDLRVNSFCGDGFLNKPNGELTGGPFGDGYEECDGFSGTACPGGICDTQTSYDGDKSYTCTTNEATNKPVQPGTCSYTGSRCGDTLLQPEYGEECDFGVNNNCCEFCGWNFNYPTSTMPVYFTIQEDSLDYLESITLAEDEVGYIAMPDVVSFNTSSVLIDILTEVEKIIEPTAIVFITDKSGSMPNGMPNVKEALVGTTDIAATEALSGSVIYELREMANLGDPLYVGLVAFSDTIQTKLIGDLQDNSIYEDIVGEIVGYQDNGVTHTKDAIEEAHTMFNDPAFDDFHKFYILLSDGEPNPTDQNPIDYINDTIRTSASYINDKASIYSIYFAPGVAVDDLLLKDMCSWSNDGDSAYDCVTSCNVDGCDGANYTYLSTTGLSSAYDSIVEDISTEPSNNFLDISVNGVNSSYITLIPDEDQYLGEQLILNNVSCDPQNIKCSPSYIPFMANFTSGTGTMTFSNLNMKVLESCEIE